MVTPASLAWLLTLAMAPQASDAAIVNTAAVPGPVPWSALGLGDGGIGRVVVAAAPRPGEAWTAGGVRVRAAREGVKLDFPSGAELLVGPDGAVHLRSGEHSAPRARPVDYWLTDGARLRVQPAGQRSLAAVTLVEGGTARLLWRSGQALLAPERVPVVGDISVLMLGDGRTLFQAARLGPILTLTRLVCPAHCAASVPKHKLVVLGQALVDALQQLPARVPLHAVQVPQGPQAARNLALMAPLLFPLGTIERPRGSLGQLEFALAGDFRLRVEMREGNRAWLVLRRADAPIGIVEWSVGSHTTMHLVRPEGGAGGQPRYWLAGQDLTRQIRPLLPLADSHSGMQQVLAVLRLMMHG